MSGRFTGSVEGCSIRLYFTHAPLHNPSTNTDIPSLHAGPSRPRHHGQHSTHARPIPLPSGAACCMVAAALNSCMFPGPIAVVTTLTKRASIARGIFIEMFLTSFLIFVILMLAAEKSKATFIAPAGIGLALFVAELCGLWIRRIRSLVSC